MCTLLSLPACHPMPLKQPAGRENCRGYSADVHHVATGISSSSVMPYAVLYAIRFAHHASVDTQEAFQEHVNKLTPAFTLPFTSRTGNNCLTVNFKGSFGQVQVRRKHIDIGSKSDLPHVNKHFSSMIVDITLTAHDHIAQMSGKEPASGLLDK